MRRLSVVALATSALLALSGVASAEASALPAAAQPAQVMAASSIHVSTATTTQHKKKHKKKRKKATAGKRRVQTTFANESPKKATAKKPAAKKPAAKRPAAKKPAAKPAKPAKPLAPSSNPQVNLARGMGAAADRSGFATSLYQGAWFMPSVEPIRKCIMDRESNFSYTAVGAGTYFGAYQMNRNLAIGATHAMEAEVRKELGAEGVRILRSLRQTTPNHWNRYWQDRAFYTIWHKGAGKGNWRGGGLRCF